jgi:dipeptide/tripeptide permease
LVICHAGEPGSRVYLDWLNYRTFALWIIGEICMPPVAVAALHRHVRAAGAASAAVGTLMFGTGAVATAIVTSLAEGTIRPILAVIRSSQAARCSPASPLSRIAG